MLRNDYRRALIMLRSSLRGAGGHVRLERRTLIGSLRFSVNGVGAQDTLYALLLREKNGAWTVANLGEMRADGRGQAGLNRSIDPRDIQGADLDEYTLAGVARKTDDGARLVMTGFVNGTRAIDADQAEVAVSRMFGDTPDPDPAEGESPVAEEFACCCDETPSDVSEAADTSADTPDNDISAEAPPVSETALRAQIEEEFRLRYEDEAQRVMEQVRKETEDKVRKELLEEAEAARKAAEEEKAEAERKAAEEEKAEEETARHRTAYAALSLDENAVWPDSLKALRELFETETACEISPVEGYTFVDTALPEDSGMTHCVIGLSCADNRPRAVCYAIPGQFAEEAPAGLTGYQYVRDANGAGWWVLCVDAETGEDLETGE